MKQALIYEVGKIIGSVSEFSNIIEQITQMTQQALKAEASSALILDKEKKNLIFHVATGPVNKTLTQTRINAESGIAGWVVRQGTPLIVNDVTQDRRFNKDVDAMTGFITKAIMCVPMVVYRETIGALQVLNKIDGSDFNEDDLETLKVVASTAAMSIENDRLHRVVLEGYKSTIKTLAAAIDAKDPYTYGHSERVTNYALLGATTLSLGPQELQSLEYAGILHDIGKIAVSDSILLKPGPLTSAEWEIMRSHPTVGADIIAHVPFLKEARDLILHHHEKFDQTGYPDGLGHEDIPIGARLLSVADAFDTMTTNRAYRAALSVDFALAELHRCEGTQFCPVAVEAFILGLKKC